MQQSTRFSSSRSNNRLFGFAAPALLFLILFSIHGCAASQGAGSVSDSFGSISDSLGSFSDSSQSSSGDETAYREDIRDFTIAHIRSDGTPESLRLGLSEVALARGISDWEALPATFAAIGAGLAASDLDASTLEIYQTAVVQPGSSNAQTLRDAFDQALLERASGTPSVSSR